MTKNKIMRHLLTPVVLGACACSAAPEASEGELGSLSQALINTNVTLTTFQVPEMVPNTPLSSVDPINGSVGNLKRSSDDLRVVLNAKSLPAGAYTFWWHLTYPDTHESILQAGSALVTSNGNAHIDVSLGEGLESAPGFVIFGDGLREGTSETVDAEIWVRYHGAASSDPDALEFQLTHPWGGCADYPNNPDPQPGDYPCWNPQRASFGTP